MEIIASQNVCGMTIPQSVTISYHQDQIDLVSCDIGKRYRHIFSLFSDPGEVYLQRLAYFEKEKYVSLHYMMHGGDKKVIIPPGAIDICHGIEQQGVSQEIQKLIDRIARINSFKVMTLLDPRIQEQKPWIFNTLGKFGYTRTRDISQYICFEK